MGDVRMGIVNVLIYFFYDVNVFIIVKEWVFFFMEGFSLGRFFVGSFVCFKVGIG